MSKFFLILPILAINCLSDVFCNPFDNIKNIFMKTDKKPSQLKRKNQIRLDNKINNNKNNNENSNDYVIIDKDDIVIEEEDSTTKRLLNEIKKNKQIEKQYNETKKEYDELMNDSRKQLQLSQEKLNKQNEIINNMNNVTQQYNNKAKLNEYFQHVIKLLSNNLNLENINRINDIWKNIIKNSITIYKFDKQYVKNTWETIYKKRKSKLNKYDFNTKQLEILNLSKAIEFIDNYYNQNKLNETLQKIISIVLKNNNIETIKKANKLWNSAIKLAINENKLSKDDVKSIWKKLYDKNIKLLEDKIIYLWYVDENSDLYDKVSKTNLFDLDKAIEFIEGL